MAAWCARRTTARSSSRSTKRRSRRCRASSRWCATAASSGVIAEREEQAIKASVALGAGAKWTAGPPLPDQATFYEHLLSLPDDPHVVSEKQAALPDGVKVIEATYRKPYTCHAAIGPSCAVAQLRDGKMTVWSHSQGVFPLRGNLVMGLKMPADKIHCIHMEGSGCYGHNAADDVALDVALLARAAPGGRPVRLQWMRGDEFGWEPFGPAMVMKTKAALGADGRIVDWNYDVWTNTHSTRPRPRRQQSAGELVSGRAAEAGAARHHSAARGRRRPQRHPAL